MGSKLFPSLATIDPLELKEKDNFIKTYFGNLICGK